MSPQKQEQLAAEFLIFYLYLLYLNITQAVGLVRVLRPVERRKQERVIQLGCLVGWRLEGIIGTGGGANERSPARPLSGRGHLASP